MFVRTAGAGAPIVFCHGNSCSSRCFDKQLRGPLAAHHHLIAIDLPGHGDSPPGSNPSATYSLAGYAAALASVASALDVRDAVFVGWSLGGHALVDATDRLPDARGFLIFGTPPVPSFDAFLQATFPHPAIQAGFREDSTDDEIRELVGLFFRPGYPVPELFCDDFRRTDKRARSHLAASASAGFRDESAIVSELRCPLAIVHGSEDQLIRRTYFDGLRIPSLWRGAVQNLAKTGHAVQWERPDEFDELLGQFAAECFSA